MRGFQRPHQPGLAGAVGVAPQSLLCDLAVEQKEESIHPAAPIKDHLSRPKNQHLNTWFDELAHVVAELVAD